MPMPSGFRGGASDSNEHHVPPPGTAPHAISAALRTNQPLSAGTLPASVSSIRASSIAARMLLPGTGRPRLGVEPVADAAHGVHEARLARVLAELLAQLRHVHVDDVIVAEPVRSPYRLEQLRARECHARPAGESVEQVELDARQLDRTAIEAHL